MSAVLVVLIVVAAFWAVCFILALFMSGDVGDALIAATALTFSIIAIIGVILLARWLIEVVSP